MTASIKIATFFVLSLQFENTAQFYLNTGQALYQAKHQNNNQVKVF